MSKNGELCQHGNKITILIYGENLCFISCESKRTELISSSYVRCFKRSLLTTKKSFLNDVNKRLNDVLFDT